MLVNVKLVRNNEKDIIQSQAYSEKEFRALPTGVELTYDLPHTGRS